jgi:hypothetical protein
MSEEQVFSGLGAMPGFHGRTDSTTETFADVVYYLLTAQVANMQRPVTRRQERTYMLDLRLGGIEVDSVSVRFNKAHSRNAKAEAETEEIKQRVVFDRVRAGLIAPDEGAQELGYEAWEDLELLFGARFENAETQQKRTLRLTFDRSSQMYRYLPERIELAGDSKILPFVKKKALQRASN